MKKYLILLPILSICLLSCSRMEPDIGMLLSQQRYRQAVYALKWHTGTLSVPLEISDLYRYELDKYGGVALYEYCYYKAYSGLKKHKKAAKHIVRYLEATGHDKPYFESGIALIDMTQMLVWTCPKYSIRLLEESLAKDKDNYQLKLVLASLYEGVSLYDSKDEYQKALDLYNEIEASLDTTQRTSLNYWKSEIYDYESEQSLAEITKALEKSGYTDLTDLYQRATIYQYGRKDYESAIKDYTRMIELSDEAYHAYYGRSRCYNELGDTLSAERDEAMAEHIQGGLIQAKQIKDSVSMSVSIRQRFTI